MQPQELEVWYVLPAIRKELALSLIKCHKLTQKKVAKMLGLRESTVSQYVKEKRAKETVFDAPVLKEIKQSAERIFKDEKALNLEIQRIFSSVRERGLLCKLHKKRESVGYCRACLK